MLAVSDTGHGMDEATRAQVFEPFFTTKASGKGTGLGLSTAYGIVKQSGGFIWVYSEPGEGTTFKVYLPQAGGTPRGDPAGAGRPRGGHRGTETILVVEDSDAVRVLVGEMLEPRGYAVLTAATGQEALAICDDPARRIDLLISDVVMPDIRGPDLQKQPRRAPARSALSLHLRVRRRRGRGAGNGGTRSAVPGKALQRRSPGRQGPRDPRPRRKVKARSTGPFAVWLGAGSRLDGAGEAA